jgi:glycosyltransferase involved in cell wall biosynthesis
MAGELPEGWPGWPSGKRIALVLTHDVEGSHGLEQCRELAEFEMKLGLRSSFNFIPQGSYSLPDQLRHWLSDQGFEVGVHDLYHDGRLYWDSHKFNKSAVQINEHIREWGAVGFRSGFMLRNLNWLHRLNIRYDSSTFDTDPFEPQPDGAGTIFPYWVNTPLFDFKGAARNGHEPDETSLSSAATRGGYLELPYTLPQDSTLFLVLGETSPEIWKKKLDWIASNGGMALLNVHPDYIEFRGRPRTKRKFSIDIYSEFLKYALEKYAGQFWNPLPRELCGWYEKAVLGNGPQASTQAPRLKTGCIELHGQDSLRGKEVAVLLYSHYPSDPRPRRAAEALAQMGMAVEVFCLKQEIHEATRDVINGVKIRRLPIMHERGGKIIYLWNYALFIVASFFLLARRSLSKRYDLVHVHNMPDVLVFGAMIPKLRGAKVILDLHDPMPELMMTIFGSKRPNKAIRLLEFLEKLSIGFANRVITVNEACKKLFSDRTGSGGKINVVMNSPDEKIFKFYEISNYNPLARGPGDRFVIMYHGSLVERHGLDLAVTALETIRHSIPQAELRIYGNETPFLEQVMGSLEGRGLKEAVKYYGRKNLAEIVEAIGECDVGVIPNRRSIFTEINTPTRIFEYISQGKPVIVPRAQGILDYFSSDSLVFFELGDAADLADKLTYVYRDPKGVHEIVRRGQAVYREHRWSSERNGFIEIVLETLGFGRQRTAAHLRPGKERLESGG